MQHHAMLLFDIGKGAEAHDVMTEDLVLGSKGESARLSETAGLICCAAS